MTELMPAATGSSITELVALLEQAGAMTPTKLDLPADLTYEQFTGVGTVLAMMDEATSWWIGDWLNYGENHIANYEQAVHLTGLAEDTLAQWAWVARQVPPERRREDVKWTMHRAVAPLTAREQTRWLAKAAKKQWTASDLKRALKPPPDPADEAAITRVIPATLEEVARAIVRDMKDADDPSYMLVPVETIKRLLAALGQEDGR